jgi:hypothetical protein
MKPRLLPSKSFSINFSLILPPFDTI